MWEPMLGDRLVSLKMSEPVLLRLYWSGGLHSFCHVSCESRTGTCLQCKSLTRTCLHGDCLVSPFCTAFTTHHKCLQHGCDMTASNAPHKTMACATIHRHKNSTKSLCINRPATQMHSNTEYAYSLHMQSQYFSADFH